MISSCPSIPRSHLEVQKKIQVLIKGSESDSLTVKHIFDFDNEEISGCQQL
jgi:hypothetical protein